MMAKVLNCIPIVSSTQQRPPGAGRQRGPWARPAGYPALLILLVVGLFCHHDAMAQANARLLLTSNIQGRAILDIQDQETQDPLLILAQNILAEKEKGIDLYLDLGNGFYPGVISKFSSGSIMMDFFDFFSCTSTLVSSKDLQIGLENLEFLQKNKSTHLISANILRDGEFVFTPYIMRKIDGIRVAFVGLSSKRVDIDVAEKELYDISQENEKKVLTPILEQLDTLGVEHIVLLSGLRLSLTMRLLQSHEQIDMALCGGDYTGSLFNGKITRIDLNDGRSVVMLDNAVDYFIVDLLLEKKGISLQAVAPHKAVAKERLEDGYIEFRNRLSLWKQKYLTDQSRQIAKTDDQEHLLDDQRLLQMLRDRFNCEIAVVETKTITPYPFGKDISQSDLLHLVNRDYKIFSFHLTGDQVFKLIAQKVYNLETAGLVRGKKIKVQGYPLDRKRRYSIAATQSAFRKIKHVLGADIPYKNSWETITDLMTADLENRQVLLRGDYAYLDNRFRTLIDIYLSNYISSGSVDRGPTIATPVAQPSKSYSKWGLEDKIDLTIYNQYHRLVLTPYILYARQDNDYIQNLLRGTFLYEYNLGETLKPYNKFQCDSVVESVEGQRPVLIRETVGGSFYGDYMTTKLGLGLEKKVQDPAEDALYGFETILTFKYPLFKHVTYTFNIDNFISTRNPDNGRWGLRSEIDNILSASLNNYLSISLKYKYFYLYESDLEEDYRSSQIFTTLDLKTDWKFW